MVHDFDEYVERRGTDAKKYNQYGPREVEIAKAKLNLLNGQYQQKQRDYQDLRAETLRVIRGDSRLNVDFLNSIVDETITQLKELGQQVKEAEAELRELVSR